MIFQVKIQYVDWNLSNCFNNCEGLEAIEYTLDERGQVISAKNYIAMKLFDVVLK